MKSALKADHWRSAIDESESNWYLRHQSDYGSWQWIEKRLFIYALSAWLCRTGSYYLFYFIPLWSSSTSLTIIYWFSYCWFWAYNEIMPIFVLYYILCHISILDDAIGMKKELNVISKMFSIVTVLKLIGFAITATGLIATIDPNVVGYWGPIILNIRSLLSRTLQIPINYMQSRWVVSRFVSLIHREPGNLACDSNAISLSSTKMRGIVNQSTLNLIDHSIDSLTPNSEEVRFVMKSTLMKYTAFEGFMRFLLEVFLH